MHSETCPCCTSQRDCAGLSRKPGTGPRLHTMAPLLFMVLSLFAHGLNDRIAAVSKLRTTGSWSIQQIINPKAHDFSLPASRCWSIFRLHLRHGSAFFTPAPRTPASADQFLPTFHAHVSTSMQTQCTGRVGQPTCIRMLKFLVPSVVGTRKARICRRTQSPHTIELLRITFFMSTRLQTSAAATKLLSLVAVRNVCLSGATG